MEYKMKIITQEQLDEIQRLADAGHRDAIWAYACEAVNAAKEGYEHGYKCGVMKSLMRGIAYGAVIEMIAFSSYKFGKFVKDKYQEKKCTKETETKK